MLTDALEAVRLPKRRPHWGTSRLWREWCFVRAAVRHFRSRLLLIVLLMLGGALAFKHLEPEKQHSLPKAVYFTWSLIFGEPPEAFPTSPILQGLFFVLPALGLIVILETLVDFALLLRDRRRNERSWCKTMTAALSNHIILVGVGKLGYRTYRLLRRLGEAVVVIERDPANQFLEDLRRDGCPLFVGDARREAFLEDANVARAKSIVLATNHDLANLEVALDARRFNPAIRVVLRMFDQNMADKIRYGFNLQVAMSQSAISAPTFVMAAIDSSIVNSTVIDDQLVVMKRWYVHRAGPLCDRTVAEVMVEYGVGVVQRTPRGGTVQLMPPPDTRLVDGDELLVQGTYEVLSELRNQERAPTSNGVPSPDESAA
ncbi:MAG: NAD-binding protein [Phycisphaerae bacterium]